MNPHTIAPSLFGRAEQAQTAQTLREPRTLVDLMYDGFYLLFLLKNRNPPQDADRFTTRIKGFLDDLERRAKKAGIATEDIFAAKYAFCAAVDETLLSSPFTIRETWERQPLQLVFFGEQLAGERFFERLEDLRRQGAARLQSLEVFHLCLLLGFQGKYLMEGPEKLKYLTARLGDDIAHFKGKRSGFAPYWQIPDQVSHFLKNEVPLWIIVACFAVTGLAALIGFQWLLADHTGRALAQYADIIRMPAQAAHITVTLP